MSMPETPIIGAHEVPIVQLVPYYRNPRRGNVERIAESLATSGQYRPIVVNIGTHTGRENEVLAGNHTMEAARSLGWATIAVTWVDVDNERAKVIVLADNRTGDLAKMDDLVLERLLTDLQEESSTGLTGTGYTDQDLADLLASLTPDDDETPEPTGPVFSARIVFDDEQDLAEWEDFVARLRERDPDREWTSGRRVLDYINQTWS